MEGVLISFSKVVGCLPLSMWEESLGCEDCSGADETLEGKEEFEAEGGSDEVEVLEVEVLKLMRVQELVKRLERFVIDQFAICQNYDQTVKR
ncbi:hypothetical protein F8M41_018120 [Gigaspora margarita]|uniref:Uncharacterized protein n=1 Tax=Gigaspora margarita TaxID=4874 RepID=A0A8H4B2T7_GIGMA|nr:hypothetical protein F8M41_018120 [Gigaspora margarita]